MKKKIGLYFIWPYFGRNRYYINNMSYTHRSSLKLKFIRLYIKFEIFVVFFLYPRGVFRSFNNNNNINNIIQYTGRIVASRPSFFRRMFFFLSAQTHKFSKRKYSKIVFVFRNTTDRNTYTSIHTRNGRTC